MEENNNGFEVISSKTLNSDFKNKNKFNWGKNVFLPFASGVVGCSVVLGTCFGVPAIREKLVGRTSSIQTSTSSANGTTTNLVSLSNFSNTSIFAASKILPSIVGIEVSYNVTTNSFFGFGGSQTSSATATGSGIIISEDGYCYKQPCC